jgi:hypothetical protein
MIIKPVKIEKYQLYGKYDGFVQSGTCEIKGKSYYFDWCIQHNWYADESIYGKLADSYGLYNIYKLPDALMRKLLYLNDIWNNPKKHPSITENYTKDNNYWTYKTQFLQNWFPGAKTYWQTHNLSKFGKHVGYGVIRNATNPHRVRFNRKAKYPILVGKCELDYRGYYD